MLPPQLNHQTVAAISISGSCLDVLGSLYLAYDLLGSELFFLGDGHARQGDGEVLGSAIETSLDVEFSVDLIKGKKINWPRLENQDFIMVLGSSRAINEALQHATTELMRWLMESYGFDERGASLLLGQGMEYEIANVVDPEFTIAAKMRKQYLAQLKVEWVRPASQTGQVPVVQENIADGNIELKEYGPAAKELLTSGTPGSESTPFTVWSGACTGPFAITFRQKNNYVDLTGLGRIRWTVKTSGFHEVRPVVKLADGTLLVGDHTDASVAMFSVREFPLADVRWMKLDPNRVVTLGVQGPANQIWVNNPDLSKVDEVGLVDLMPGGGHGVGGYIHLGAIEVYGKAVPRATTTSSR